MSMHGLVEPHGGRLVDRTGAKAEAAPRHSITLNVWQQCDFEMIGCGAMLPLDGFMGEADYHGVCDNMKLAGGATWPIPITLAVDETTAAKVGVGDRVALNDDQGRLLGYISVREKYKQDKRKQAIKAFGTEDLAHPGVKNVMNSGDNCLAGAIDVVTSRHDPMFTSHRLTPKQTRAEFEKRSWKTIVAFQTRNPIHRAHEYLTKCAQEIVDGPTATIESPACRTKAQQPRHQKTMPFIGIIDRDWPRTGTRLPGRSEDAADGRGRPRCSAAGAR